MLLPISWLKQFVPNLPPTTKLVDQLMMHGLEVEEIIDGSSQFDQVIVGEIKDIRPHPNADKLRLAEVIVAPDGESQEIVCGAPNIAVGQKVPVALLGAKLPNGLTIERRAIRGVESNGMLCAADELGLGDDHAGIMILDARVKPGTPLAIALGSENTVLDISAPANRADLMAVRGLAWEIAAILKKKVKFKRPTLKESTASADKSITAIVADPKKCPLYTARVIRGVAITESPVWMQQRLRAAGMRPINAVVDATNYVMLEYGQPLHAFDAAKVLGPITARPAKSGERLQTIDQQIRELDPSRLVIADTKGPIAIAGVMGGRDSEVTGATTDIILEAAIFDPVSVRRTSRQLGLVSEASKRFEKGLWPSLTVQASHAAAALIVELCGGEVEKGLVTTGQLTTPLRTLAVDPKYISERLGQPVASGASKKILTALGFAVTGTAKQWTVRVPEWRLDVSLAEDIVDEVGRMLGYGDLPESAIQKIDSPEVPTAIRFKAGLQDTLIELGFTEVISHAFYGEQAGAKVRGEHFAVANPLDDNQRLLRKSLVPQLSDILKRQANAGEDAMIFELGRIFDPRLTGSVEKQQPWKLALGLTHKNEPQLAKYIQALQRRVQTTTKPETHFAVEGLVRGRKIELCEFDVRTLLADARAELPAWDPTKNVATNARYRAQSKYPAVKRDIAFWWVGTEAEIEKTIDGLKLALLTSYSRQDKFTKDGKTSYAYGFVYQSPERTLTKAEVDNLEEEIKEALKKGGAVIR